MLNHLADVESDFSAIHRIDNIWDMDSARFFKLAERLAAYQGTIRMRAESQAVRDREAGQARGNGGAAAPVRTRQEVAAAVPVGTGELGKIDGLGGLVSQGLLSIEQAT